MVHIRIRIILASLCLTCLLACEKDHDPEIMSVLGPISAGKMGKTLIHEHVFLDWSGAEESRPEQWNEDEAFEAILPHIEEAKDRGVKTMLECTPAYLGRNPQLLRRLSEETGMQFLTNTGYYGARGNKYLPEHALSETPDQLADRWVKEWEEGIDGTGIRPGFIKIGVSGDSILSPTHEKLVRAAARTHLRTGLTIVGHTGPQGPAYSQLRILEEEGVAPEAFVWTHAQGGTEASHIAIAKMGAWVSLDGMGWMALREDEMAQDLPEYVNMLKNLKANKLLKRTLIAHDAGWYSVGEPGATYAEYTNIFDHLIPALKKEGFSGGDIKQLLETNPRRAYRIRPRKLLTD